MKIIESKSNPAVKQWKKLIEKKKERMQQKKYIVEGFHLVEEALSQQNTVEVILFAEGVVFPSNWQVDPQPCIQISQDIARDLAQTETSQSIFAICHIKEQNIAMKAGKYVLLDRIQDPGNLGTIIRSAHAAGVDAIIAGRGTVDLFNSKTLRAAQGSHFHIPIVTADLIDTISKLQDSEVPVYATGWTEAAISYKKITAGAHYALIVGNEGEGVAQELFEASNEVLFIPMPGRAESLNVAIACSVILFHLNED